MLSDRPYGEQGRSSLCRGEGARYAKMMARQQDGMVRALGRRAKAAVGCCTALSGESAMTTTNPCLVMFDSSLKNSQYDDRRMSAQQFQLV